jgi:hypothetical protein
MIVAVPKAAIQDTMYYRTTRILRSLISVVNFVCLGTDSHSFQGLVLAAHAQTINVWNSCYHASVVWYIN